MNVKYIHNKNLESLHIGISSAIISTLWSQNLFKSDFVFTSHIILCMLRLQLRLARFLKDQLFMPTYTIFSNKNSDFRKHKELKKMTKN